MESWGIVLLPEYVKSVGGFIAPFMSNGTAGPFLPAEAVEQASVFGMLQVTITGGVSTATPGEAEGMSMLLPTSAVLMIGHWGQAGGEKGFQAAPIGFQR